MEAKSTDFRLKKGIFLGKIYATKKYAIIPVFTSVLLFSLRQIVAPVITDTFVPIQ